MQSELLETMRVALADRYTVTREIALGGMSRIFQATDLRHGREVAIKVLRPEIAMAVTVDRFLQEIRIEAGLQHPHILPLLDSGLAGSLPYCVLPLVTGPTLRDRLRTEGQLTIDEAMRVTNEIASALAHAHDAGVIHRDVKPENILFQDGHAILADFGIARALHRSATEKFTSEGMAIGTPAYMSPEQAGGASTIDGRSDLYSLGVVLFEMLAGEPPFTGRTVDAVIAKHRLESPPSLVTLRATVPAPLEEAVTRVLAKSPADRFANAGEFVAALTTLSVRARIRRTKRLQAYAALGVASLLLGGWLLLRPGPVLDENTIAVFPVRDPAAGTGSAVLPDDIAYAIELALDHARPLRWAHGWDWLDESVRSDPALLDARLERRLALANGARYFIEGLVRRTAAEQSVVLRLYDAGADTVIATESATGPATADLATLGVAATGKLLLRWLAPGRAADLAPLQRVAPAALALQLQGEREYRAARFTRALELFERALAEDSTFAYAAVKAAQSASWLNLLGRAELLAARAARMQASLPAQYRPFAVGLEAYLTGRGDSAVTMLREALALAPDWDEAHMALGEVFYHLLPDVDEADALAIAQFDSAASRDARFTPPLTHLAEDAARRGDRRALAAYLDRLRSVAADIAWIRSLDIMHDCLENPRRADWVALARIDPGAALNAAEALGVAMAQSACAEAGWRALLAPTVNEGVRWGALLGLQGALVAQGRAAEALALLDSARAAGTSTVLYLYLLDAMAGAPFAARADEVVTFARENLGDDYARAGPHTLWFMAAWHAARGDTAMVRRLDARVAAAAQAAPADRRVKLLAGATAAHAALARADTSRAIELLRGLRATARRDSLSYDLFEPLAIERLRLAELLMARRDFRGALVAASAFDHQEPIAFLPFLPRSLQLRAAAADSTLQPQLGDRYRRRLAAMTRAGESGPR